MSIIEKAIRNLDKNQDVGANSSNLSASQEEVVAAEPVRSAPQQPATSVVPEGVESEHGFINIPVSRLAALGMLSPSMPNSQIAEEYRGIKRPLLLNIDGKGATEVQHANLIMVASALPGEGKTFSAVNLALSIAMEQGKSVLFVDADVSKASAGALLGVPKDSVGLIDLLEDKTLGFRDVVLKTNIPNLRILPSGKLHQRATELLASDDMKSFMLELSQRYPDRIIVFDSPPLLLTTEARVLANFMGQIVFVVAAGKTSHEAVTDALQYIGNDTVVGMVLNRSNIKASARYGYGYGYGYGGRT